MQKRARKKSALALCICVSIDKNIKIIIIYHIDLEFICISNLAFRRVFREIKMNNGGMAVYMGEGACNSAGGRIMGKLNNALNLFLQDNTEFADMINLSVYQGKKVVLPEQLEDKESVMYPQNHRGEILERRNDVSKKCKNGSTYQIFCLENESKIDYTMPVRGMEYEASRYREQIKVIAEDHRKKEYKNWSEFSSHFTKEDKLYPVLTIVLYWSREPWDGAKSLVDMLNISAEEKRALEPFLQNYKLNLINMYDLEDHGICEGQLKYILRLLHLDKDKKAMYDEVKSNPGYKRLKPETGQVLFALLGSREIERQIELQKTGEGEIDMCKALEDLWNDTLAEGEEKGKEKGRREERSRINQLFSYLAEEKRYGDMERAARDMEYQDQLFIQYGL